MTTTRSHFTFHVDKSAKGSANGESIVEHVASVEDYEVALATFRAACQRWPSIPITLRQGPQLIENSRGLRMAWSGKGREKWILVLAWIGPSGALTASSIPHFESKQACENALNVLKSRVTWGSNVDLIGTCVSAKWPPD
jgi:hypothetical protein